MKCTSIFTINVARSFQLCKGWIQSATFLPNVILDIHISAVSLHLEAQGDNDESVFALSNFFNGKSELKKIHWVFR